MDQDQSSDKWFFCKQAKPQASTRLFCFPFGGGGASVFHSWADAMGDDVEVRALQLPGRESRFREEMVRDIGSVVENITRALASCQDRPYAFFGYSLGSLLAFETCRELRRQNLDLPQRLFIGALSAPQLPPPHPPIASLGDREFTDRVEYYYQPQNEAWENAELRAFLLPLLKADIALYESYRYRDEAPLSCPIDVLAGDDDRATPVESTRDWSRQTSAGMTHHLLGGGHFFIDAHLDEIQRLVRKSLQPEQ